MPSSNFFEDHPSLDEDSELQQAFAASPGPLSETRPIFPNLVQTLSSLPYHDPFNFRDSGPSFVMPTAWPFSAALGAGPILDPSLVQALLSLSGHAPFNFQDSGPSSVMPTAWPFSAALEAGSLFGRIDQGFPPPVVNGASSVHAATSFVQGHPPRPQPDYNRPHESVGQAVPASMMQTSPPVASFPPPRPPTRHSTWEAHLVTNSPYAGTQSSSFPVPVILPKETKLHKCKWTVDDGTGCEVQFTYAMLSEHLATHGVKDLPGTHLLKCKWSGCRPRKNKEEMMRESILRHVREKHLGYKRKRPIAHLPSPVAESSAHSSP